MEADKITKAEDAILSIISMCPTSIDSIRGMLVVRHCDVSDKDISDIIQRMKNDGLATLFCVCGNVWVHKAEQSEAKPQLSTLPTAEYATMLNEFLAALEELDAAKKELDSAGNNESASDVVYGANISTYIVSDKIREIQNKIWSLS